MSNISAYFQCIVTYCCSRENETRKPYQSSSFSTDYGLTCNSIGVTHTFRKFQQTNNFDVKAFHLSSHFMNRGDLAGRASYHRQWLTIGISCSNSSGPVKRGILIGYTAKL